MRRPSLAWMWVLVFAGCPGGGNGIGETCGDNGDCSTSLQCIAQVCVPRCQRAPECGDGYSCDAEGLCHLATGQAGDACKSQVDCAPGLACEIDGAAVDDSGRLVASCTAQNVGRPAGSSCATDNDCRNGTCAMGHCIDLCSDARDCGAGNGCTGVPRIDAPANGTMFEGCVPSQGAIVWSIPIPGPEAHILLPIPETAQSAELVMVIDDLNQRVGATEVTSPASSGMPGVPEYSLPCDPPGTVSAPCTPDDASDQYFAQPIRHMPGFGQSVLAIPSGQAAPLQPGAYSVTVSSLRSSGVAGSAIPRVTAVVKLDAAVILDLHFYFLDLTDHPCATAFGTEPLAAASASTASFFQNDFLGQLRGILAPGGIALGTVTYEDVLDHPDLDGLDIADAGSLLALGAHDVGINVFFVRTLSPVGLQAFGPNPGPAGLAGTSQSGIVVAADTLCYRSWPVVARLTAHELARYMGLYHNVELETAQHSTWRDPIDDSDDASTNLMFFSEFGGNVLSDGQRDILTRSAVLR